MGLPAVRRDVENHRVRPALRVVKPQTRKASRRDTRASVAATRRTFIMFAALVLVVAALGVGRVWLSVQATEMARESSRLRADIKSERYEGDMLEVRQSALGSPSRIQAIAGKAMGMAPAEAVTYLDLTAKPKKKSAPQVQAKVAPKGSGLGAALAKVMDLSAEEAQLLLVGDVGLASAR